MFILVKSIFYLWSLLPMPLLHLQSSVAAWCLEHVVGYRRKVILDNLRGAFPELGEKELKQIRRRFYLNFCDVFLETVKLCSISREALKKRMEFLNPEVVEEMVAHGGGGIAVFGHYTNWEWLGAGMGLQLPFATIGVYKPQRNKVFDRLMLHLRTRLGNEMIAMKETYRESLRRLKDPCYIAFLGDQTPLRHKGMYFTSFLGRETPVFLGMANIALKMDVPLYYFDIRRKKRGTYIVKLVKIPHEDLLPFSKDHVYSLTDRHVKYLEQVIQAEPADWLWSHRRWKHSPQNEDILSIGLQNVSD